MSQKPADQTINERKIHFNENDSVQYIEEVNGIMVINTTMFNISIQNYIVKNDPIHIQGGDSGET